MLMILLSMHVIMILIMNLEHDSLIAMEWFECNYMKLNESKCHFLISGNKVETVWAKVGQCKIWEERNVKLLGINIDSQLNFNNEVSYICKKS